MDTLTIDLFEPGMSALHRAGLGGLACSLVRLSWPKDEYSVEDGRRVTLRWPGGPAGAGAFLERLYSSAFGLEHGLIHLPGAYGKVGPSAQVKALLQRGLSQTILQFGPNRKKRGSDLRLTYQIDDRPMFVEHQDLLDYTHRGAWRDLVSKDGALKDVVSIAGTIAPGFIRRHNAHPSSEVKQPPGLAIALHFALVGTLSLYLAGGKGVLIIPDVENLDNFVARRSWLNPEGPNSCQVGNPADAALQAQVRLRGPSKSTLAHVASRSLDAAFRSGVDRCHALLFSSTVWNKNQKARTKALTVDPGDDGLDRFEYVMSIEAFKPRVAEAKPEKKGDPPRWFWADSVCRALIAENVANRRPWFENFRSLVVGPDGKNDEQKARRVSYEKEGLHEMIDQRWEDNGEELLVKSVHEAMLNCFGKIWEDSGHDQTTSRKRRERQMDRWRIAFAHAKTSDDVRAALSDMWSRAGRVQSLMESWPKLLPVICDDQRWQLNRDLALLALCSYKPRKQWEAEVSTTPIED